ncbi:hypothetical protein HOS54_gp006 [Klebsiella phage Menlow]|uniref:Uncharacterized protein n=1 Tax=Klebsiella phage Menlow TaxID=2054273 RepID=A0A2H5BN48_9CAUD|nr:hypothetical protein HOS54_gp006 [Klebsiella phage Menlow]AUG87712.1 hypothetical protein CPT_Menlow_006 [Klebsiella phage Menlow]
MSEPKKIVIIGGGRHSIIMKTALQDLHPEWEIKQISIEDHMSARELARREENDKRIVILDEICSEFDVKQLINSLKSRRRLDDNDFIETSLDERQLMKDARYQKPPRLRGAAQHKRLASKARNKGKRK